MILSPAVLTMNNVKVSAAEMGQTQNQSAFIEQLGASAMQVSASNDLYASIMVAQALVETGFGTSQLSARTVLQFVWCQRIQWWTFSVNEHTGIFGWTMGYDE